MDEELKNLIIIEDGNKIQCTTEKEVVKALIAENFYEMSFEEQREILELKATANSSLGRNIKVIDKYNLDDNLQLENSFVILNERTYILSLLINSSITLLENVNSNIYTSNLDKTKFSKNYIIVNKFAKEILELYLENYKKENKY